MSQGTGLAHGFDPKLGGCFVVGKFWKVGSSHALWLNCEILRIMAEF